MVPMKSRNLVLCILLLLGALSVVPECLALPSASSPVTESAPARERCTNNTSEGDPDHYETKAIVTPVVQPGLAPAGGSAIDRAAYRSRIEEILRILNLLFGHALRFGG